MTTIQTMPVGILVGANRWPMHGSHPDGWGKPWMGELLAPNDPRAWAGSIALGDNPSQADTDRHIEWCKSTIPGGMSDNLPVLWDFNGEKKIYWESVASLRPYSEDLAEWKAERDRARGVKIQLANTTTLADFGLVFGRLPRWRRKWLVQSQVTLRVNGILASGSEN